MGVGLGRVGLVLRGVWDSGTAYVALDVVSHEGNSWAAKRANTNVEPSTTNSDDWQLLANNAEFLETVEGYVTRAEAAAETAEEYGFSLVLTENEDGTYTMEQVVNSGA